MARNACCPVWFSARLLTFWTDFSTEETGLEVNGGVPAEQNNLRMPHRSRRASHNHTPRQAPPDTAEADGSGWRVRAGERILRGRPRCGGCHGVADHAVGAGNGERCAGRARRAGPGMPGPGLPARLPGPAAGQRPAGAVPAGIAATRSPPPACLQQIGDAFRRRVASFAEANHIPVVPLKAADRNIEIMRPYLDARPGPGARRSRRSAWRRSRSGCSSPASATPTRLAARSSPSTRRDRRVTVYYFYLWDAGFGPAFIKVCTYCPWPVKVWVNGHEWAKQQARKLGPGFHRAVQRVRRLRRPGTAAEDLRQPAARHHRGVLPAVAAPAPAAVGARRPQAG